ncbi:hypothetical protein FKP32DRAFT_1757881 [Trametes sanguinea]|nr:hypothetical protein FKP32DRAFT_1757881 [Trametes sanguinea]
MTARKQRAIRITNTYMRRYSLHASLSTAHRPFLSDISSSRKTIMRFSAVVSVLVAFGQIAYAGPLSPTTAITIGATLPVSDLRIELITPQANATARQSVSHPDPDQQAAVPSLLLCQVLNCGDCITLAFSSIPVDECQLSFLYQSVAISNPGNVPLPFEVFLSPPNLCETGVEIPEQNVCFNVANNDLQDFILVE